METRARWPFPPKRGSSAGIRHRRLLVLAERDEEKCANCRSQQSKDRLEHANYGGTFRMSVGSTDDGPRHGRLRKRLNQVWKLLHEVYSALQLVGR